MQSQSIKETNKSQEKSLTIEYDDFVDDSEEEKPVTKIGNLKISNKFKGTNFKTFSAPLSPKMAQQ
jgi:hypothetical protein